MPYRIETVAFGGAGVARDEGRVVFIPFTLPSELVEADIHTEKSRFANGNLRNVVEASPFRVLPPCPYFGKCGGCQLQHATYPYQIELKRRFVQDAFERIGKIDFPIPLPIPSPEPFGYRKHISLQIISYNGTLRPCFTSRDGTPLPITGCLLSDSSGSSVFQDLQAVLDRLQLPPSCTTRVKIFKNDKRYIGAWEFSSPLSKGNIQILSSQGETSLIDRHFFRYPGHSPKDWMSYRQNDLSLLFSPYGFLQNHEWQSSRIYDLLCELLSSSEHILDLYCGIGISSLLLAKKGKMVTGIEYNSEAVETARENALQNSIEGVEFLSGSADELAQRYVENRKPDTLLVNPPQTGLGEKVRCLARFSCLRRIAYVSCNPATLARDLREICKDGFTIKEVRCFDCFPQTTHIEIVVFLERTF